MPSEIHVNDIGTIFEPTVRDEQDAIVDLGSATVRVLHFRKPSGVLVTKSTTLTTDGSDGKMRYVSLENDLDMAGIWRVEGYIETPTGEWTTNQHRFRVYPNLGAGSSP